MLKKQLECMHALVQSELSIFYQMLYHHLSIYWDLIYRFTFILLSTFTTELDIEFLNFVITKLEYRQKSGHSLSRYDCLETELKALCCVVV